MRIGVHTGEKDARKMAAYCRNIGVEDICLSCASVEGFEEKGTFKASALRTLKRSLSEMGVNIRAMLAPTPSEEAVRGKPAAEEEVDKLCKTIEAMGESEVDTALFYPIDRILFPRNRDLSTLVLGEGGRHSLESLDASLRPGGRDWPALVSFFQRVVEAAERANVKLANHIWDIHLMDRILEAVPSRYIGVNYCQGMYIIGGDPYAAVTHFGVEKIFLSHARNLVKHGPRFLDYEEVFLDRGDIDIPRCIRLLKDIGYGGIIIPEHLGRPSEQEIMPTAVQYLKQLISS